MQARRSDNDFRAVIFDMNGVIVDSEPRHERAFWVIEDSKPGIAAALAAQMRVIAITNTHPAAELRQATVVVKNYTEIERLLLGD